MQWFLLSLFVFPGILIPRRDGEALYAWLATRVLVSFGLNSLLALLLHSLGVLGPSAVLAYAVLGAITIGGVCYAERPWRADATAPRLAPTQLGLTAALGALGAYWSVLFPPRHYDSSLYHLPIPKYIANPELLEFYQSSDQMLSWMLHGSNGANLYEFFLSFFFVADSTLYRLVPPLFGVAALLGVFALGVHLCLSPRLRFLAGVLFVLAPEVLVQSSEFYVDLPLTAYITWALVYSLRAVSANEEARPAWGWLVAGVLLGSAMLLKKSGLVALSIPLMALLFFPRTRASVRAMVAVGGIAMLVSAHYVLRVPSLPEFPDIGLHYTLWESVRAFATEGVRNLFLISVSLNGAVVALFFTLMGLRAARVFQARGGEVSQLLLGFTATWAAAMVAGLHLMQRIDLMLHWNRYLLPLYPVLCLFIAHYGRALVSAALRPGPRVWVPRAGALVVLLVAVVGLAKMFPARYLEQHSFRKYDSISFAPQLSWDEKLRHAEGEFYNVIQLLNELSREEPEGRALLEDHRFLYLEPLCYDLNGVPAGCDTVESVRRAIDARKIRWIVTDSEINGLGLRDRHRNTRLVEFLASDHVHLIAEYGHYRVLEVAHPG